MEFFRSNPRQMNQINVLLTTVLLVCMFFELKHLFALAIFTKTIVEYKIYNDRFTGFQYNLIRKKRHGTSDSL